MFLKSGGYWEELEAVGYEDRGMVQVAGESLLACGVVLVLVRV